MKRDCADNEIVQIPPLCCGNELLDGGETLFVYYIISYYIILCVCVCVYVCVCVCVCVHDVCMYACMHACMMHVCIHMYIYHTLAPCNTKLS
jgi:hypothetical protein